MTSGVMQSLPGALQQARESMALMSSSTEDGTFSSSKAGRGLIFSTTTSVMVFSLSKAPNSAPPISPSFSAVCDDVTGSELQGCDLGGTRSKGFLYAIVHGSDDATVSG